MAMPMEKLPVKTVVVPATADLNNYYKSGFPKKMERKKYGLAVNERLREARVKSGLSLRKASEKLKEIHKEDKEFSVSSSTLQGYEADEKFDNHRYPPLNMLVHLASLYGCSMDYIFGFTDEIKRPTNDIFTQLYEGENVLWKGEPMTSGVKAWVIEKTDDLLKLV